MGYIQIEMDYANDIYIVNVIQHHQWRALVNILQSFVAHVADIVTTSVATGNYKEVTMTALLFTGVNLSLKWKVMVTTSQLLVSPEVVIGHNRPCLLTLKHRETHGCVVSTVATDALVLKHQAISIHNAD